MKIYVTNQSNHNLDDALRFGDEFVYVTEGKVEVFKTDNLINSLRDQLKDFEKGDLLLFTGNSVICSLCLSMLLTKFKIVKVLIFNNLTTEYVLRQIDVSRISIKED